MVEPEVSMSRLRFVTARSLFEAFPELARKSTVRPGDETPIAYLAALSAQDKFDEAVAFCAHLLPRREAVWWACGAVRAFLDGELRSVSPALAAAEKWVHEPGADNRAIALRIGNESDNADPLTWLALSAGWSGGTLGSGPHNTVPMPAYMTARAVRIAILLSAQHLAIPDRSARLHACITDGIRLVDPEHRDQGAPVRLHPQGDRQGLRGL
jgi:hypothetical protein